MFRKSESIDSRECLYIAKKNWISALFVSHCMKGEAWEWWSHLNKNTSLNYTQRISEVFSNKWIKEQDQRKWLFSC